MATFIRPRTWAAFAALLFLSSALGAADREVNVNPFLLDDFRSGLSTLGTSWEGFTDRVMGGMSEMTVGIRQEEGIPFLSMSGTVSLRNNGGFIQSRLLLRKSGKPAFDASAWTGIRLVVRGVGSGYYLFLRTVDNRLPWAFFMAPIALTGDWEEVRIPFSTFGKGDFGSFFGLNLKRLASVAVVAYKKEFAARLDLREIGFY
jgi:hypothetical protein